MDSTVREAVTVAVNQRTERDLVKRVETTSLDWAVEHAACHVAYHYDTRYAQTRSSNVADFAAHSFGDGTDVIRSRDQYNRCGGEPIGCIHCERAVER